MANHQMQVGTEGTTAKSVLKLVAGGISHEARDLITECNGYNLGDGNLACTTGGRYRLRISN